MVRLEAGAPTMGLGPWVSQFLSALALVGCHGIMREDILKERGRKINSSTSSVPAPQTHEGSLKSVNGNLKEL